MKPTGIDRFYHEAAYFAALVVYLIENKTDDETDVEVSEMLVEKPWMQGVLFIVLQAYKP